MFLAFFLLYRCEPTRGEWAEVLLAIKKQGASLSGECCVTPDLRHDYIEGRDKIMW